MSRKIAFYAPMKSPESARPSGDRRIARLFMAALEQADFDVELASQFRSWQKSSDINEARKIKTQALEIAGQLVNHYNSLPLIQRPQCWFTYHLYHKAPDWIGPHVCKELNIPYLVAEASVARKQQHGAWAMGYQSSLDALRQAALIVSLNPADNPGLATVLGDPSKIVLIPPFLEHVEKQVSSQHALRHDLSSKLRISPDCYWLLTVAMMRDDVKLQSYQQLAKAMAMVQREDWNLLIIGDGPAELIVRDSFRFDLEQRIHFLGKRDAVFIRQIMEAADLFIWPAINEAIGMVALEALSAGLPALCGDSGGISQIVADGETGILIKQPNQPDAPAIFAEVVEQLLSAPEQLASMAAASHRRFSQQHTIAGAAATLQQAITPLLKPHPGMM